MSSMATFRLFIESYLNLADKHLPTDYDSLKMAGKSLPRSGRRLAATGSFLTPAVEKRGGMGKWVRTEGRQVVTAGEAVNNSENDSVTADKLLPVPGDPLAEPG